MKAFLCHNSKDSPFVLEVARHLKRNLDGVFYYQEYQRADEGFPQTINRELNESQVMVIFVGKELTKWQVDEANTAQIIHKNGKPRSFFIVLLVDETGRRSEFPEVILTLSGFPQIEPQAMDSKGALKVAADIVIKLGRQWQSSDDLPLNPHLFSYEKDIIDFYNGKNRLGNEIFTRQPNTEEEATQFEEIRRKILNGCPSTWPKVVKWTRGVSIPNRLNQDSVGNWRAEDASVLTAALSGFSDNKDNPSVSASSKGTEQQLYFPEAGPREILYYPRVRGVLRVAILVSGGIAPGVNAVIDGIVQRHWQYAEQHGYKEGLRVYGLQNGFRAFDRLNSSVLYLAADSTQFINRPTRLETSHHVNQGGSILGTSRVNALIDAEDRTGALEYIDKQLLAWDIDVLYVIGGDGSMKAAHAIWSIAQDNPDRRSVPGRDIEARPLSVVAIPKTMDNDILWVWQSFGFLSAVEKAREVIEHLNTEVISNPRLCIAQLFGSDSGFVVSHAVLASATGHCCLALIPEIQFSMNCIAEYLKRAMCRGRQQIPFGLVVMSETAIPVDAMNYVGELGENPMIDIGLSEEEKDEIRKFDAMRQSAERIQGQTNDTLRTAGLKIVSKGLQHLLPQMDIAPGVQFQPDWKKLRIFTNEPRHLLRAIPPSCSDIIIGQRLGTLAVDNAMAGYTDFMISQWLTEYVLVPLKLVVLGRKRIPTSGIFWKSVLAKTGQPSDLSNCCD
jgi:6-phosphofructokinase 1